MATTQHLDDVKAKIEKAKEQLEAGLAALVTSEDWQRTLELMALLGPTRNSRRTQENVSHTSFTAR